MSSDPASDPYAWSSAPPRRRRFPFGLLLAMLVALAIGAGIAAFVIQRSTQVAKLVHVVPESAVPKAAALRVVAPAPVADPMIEERLAALESDITMIDQRTAAATGNADRAEALLVAFAARRALDRGVALGYIEGLLRERFGGIDPQSVAAVIAAAHQPVTLDQLRAGLEEIRPQLSIAERGEGWWDGFKHELAGLIVVRRNDAPSTIPADRVARAARLLEDGQVDRAMAELARLPNRNAAAAWMGDARRYVQARNALDRIETAALLRPQAPPPVPAVADRTLPQPLTANPL